jgi:hypothetical protein
MLDGLRGTFVHLDGWEDYLEKMGLEEIQRVVIAEVEWEWSPLERKRLNMFGVKDIDLVDKCLA